MVPKMSQSATQIEPACASRDYLPGDARGVGVFPARCRHPPRGAPRHGDQRMIFVTLWHGQVQGRGRSAGQHPRAVAQDRPALRDGAPPCARAGARRPMHRTEGRPGGARRHDAELAQPRPCCAGAMSMPCACCGTCTSIEACAVQRRGRSPSAVRSSDHGADGDRRGRHRPAAHRRADVACTSRRRSRRRVWSTPRSGRPTSST